jgi:hypothetical protein
VALSIFIASIGQFDVAPSTAESLFVSISILNVVPVKLALKYAPGFAV